MLRSSDWPRVVVILTIVGAALLPFFVESGQDRVVAQNTFALGMLTSVIALPLGITAALICLRAGPVSRLLWAVIICLAFTPTFMYVSAWDSAFGKLGWLINLGGVTNEWMRWSSAVWIHASAAIPQVALIFWFTLYRSGRSYEEQALLDASSANVFFRITLPRLLPVTAFCLLWIMVGCSREIAVTDIYRIGTFAEQIYLGYALGNFASADSASGLIPVNEFSLSVISTTVCLALLLSLTLFEYLAKLKPSEEIVEREMESVSRMHSIAGSLLIVILSLVPIGNLLVRACKKTTLIDGQAEVTYSLQNLLQVLASATTQFQEEFYWSCLIAGISALASMALGLLVVWIGRESHRFRWVLVFTFSLVIALPGPWIGSVILNAREWSDASWYLWVFDRTILPPLIANVIFCWPLACLFSWLVIENVSIEVLEHGKLEGAGSWTRLTRLVVAGNLEMLIGFLFLLFATCFGELSASQLAIPPGIDTIPRRMLGLLHSGVNDVTAGLTLILSVVILAICLAGYRVASWNRSNQVR